MTLGLTVKPGAVAVVSHTMPQDCNGQAVMLERFARLTPSAGHPPGLFFIDTARKAMRRTELRGGLPVQPVRTPWLFRRLGRYAETHRWLFPRMVQQRAAAVAAIVRRWQAAAIVGCTGGDLIDVPAAIEAGRLTGVPTFLYYFDDYAVQWRIALGRWSAAAVARFSAAVEQKALRQAAGVIVPNETLAADVGQRTHAPLAVVRNPVDLPQYTALRSRFPRPSIDRSKPLQIVYTGSVYSAQADSIRRCCDALTAAASRGVQGELHVYGPPPDREIRESLARAPISWHPPASQQEAATVQVQADMLFLPLSFTCDYPELIRSSAPGKFGEYLASGTPMIVHAPDDSFPTTFAKRHACAAVCSTPTAAALAETIATVADTPGLRERLGRAAVAVAADFSLQLNGRRFVRFLQGQTVHRAEPLAACG